MGFYHWFPFSNNGQSLRNIDGIGREMLVNGRMAAGGILQHDFSRISSVPDVWSQHNLFEMLLLDTAADQDYTEYRNIAIREWRALVAVLVLAGSHGIDIQRETINLTDGNVNNAYLKAACECRPCADDWESVDVYYLVMRGRKLPIAMSAPRVHVVPTADAWENINAVCPNVFPWISMDGNGVMHVESPVLLDGNANVISPFTIQDETGGSICAATPLEALILREWIDTYVNSVNLELSPNLNMSVMTNYRNDLTNAYQLDGGNYPAVTINANGTLTIQGVGTPQEYKLFQDTAYCFSVRQRSATSILPETDNLFGGIDDQSIYANATAPNIYDLYLIPMPVTASFWSVWNQMPPEDRGYSIQEIRTQRNGLDIGFLKVTVKLGSIRVTHVFDAAQIVNGKRTDLCAAGLWPRQNISNWNYYYMFCYECGNGYSVSVDNANAYRTYARQAEREGQLTYYQISERPSYCALQKDGKCIGYLPVRPGQKVGDGANACKMSLDFGTSSTTLFCQPDGAPNGSPVDGSNIWSLAILNPTDVGGNESNYFNKYFVPTFKSQAQAERPPFIPFQSLLADMVAGANARTPLLDSWIWFRKYSTDHSIGNANSPRFCSNLKWSNDTITGLRIQALLAQIVIIAALEARCRNILSVDMIASYPLSFDDQLKDRFFNTLQMQCNIVFADTGLQWMPDINNDLPHAEITQISESQAAYQYAASRDGLQRAPVHCVIDIGGGSTDLFVCLTGNNQDNNGMPERWSLSGSIAFGARHILLRKLLDNNKADLRILLNRSANINEAIQDTEAFADSVRDESDIEDLFGLRIPRPAGLAGVDVKETVGDEFVDHCAGSRDASLLDLKKRIAFYLAAAVYSAGLMVKDERDAYNEAAILLAGNGSKMVNWLDSNPDKISRFMRLIFAEATGINAANFTCSFSDDPKLEVAAGALQSAAVAGDITEIRFEDNAAVQQEDELGNVLPIRAVPETEEEFTEFLQVFVDTATRCFGWVFDDRNNDYSVDLLEVPMVRVKAQEAGQYHRSYFLREVDGISEYYLLR